MPGSGPQGRTSTAGTAPATSPPPWPHIIWQRHRGDPEATVIIDGKSRKSLALQGGSGIGLQHYEREPAVPRGWGAVGSFVFTPGVPCQPSLRPPHRRPSSESSTALLT